MPWTLVPHAAIAVDPDVTYVRARLDGEVLILAEALVGRVLGEGTEVLERFPGSEAARPPLRAAVSVHLRLRAARAHGAAGRLRVGGGRHRRGAHRRGLRRGRLSPGHRQRAHDPEPGAPRRHLRRQRRPVRRHVRARRRRQDHRGAARVRPPVPRRRVRARLPALLALRHAAHLLRQVELVRAHHRDPRAPAGRERGDRLAPGAHQDRAHGRLAREQRRLGDLALALLGHAAADLALRRTATSAASDRWPSCASWPARCPTTCTSRTSTR